MLAVEGLVTMKLRRGAYVTEMSRDDVAQVYHLLALLESDAAAQVADARRRSRSATQLRALHARLEKQVRQRDAFFAANEQFHMALLDIAGNRWAHADRHRPAQGDEAQPPPLAVQAGAAGRFAGRAPALMQAIDARDGGAARAG